MGQALRQRIRESENRLRAEQGEIVSMSKTDSQLHREQQRNARRELREELAALQRDKPALNGAQLKHRHRVIERLTRRVALTIVR